MPWRCYLLVLVLLLSILGGSGAVEDDDTDDTNQDDEEDDSFVMEIAIESPEGAKSAVVAGLLDTLTADLNNCLTGSPCQNNGICRKTSTQIDGSVNRGICVCPIGFTGYLCEKESIQPRFPELLEGGYLAFGGWWLSQSLTFDVHIQVKPRVLRPRTLLFFHSSFSRGLTFYVEMNRHLLHLRIYNYTNEGRYHLLRLLQHPNRLHISNGSILNIAFGLRTQNEFYLSLNNQETRGIIENTLSEVEGGLVGANAFRKENPIFIGGHPSLTQSGTFLIESPAKNNLIGCIGDVVINGHLLDPRRNAFVGDAVEGYGIENCARDVCQDHACEGGSDCKPISSTEYQCQCPRGRRPPWCKLDKTPIIPEFLGNSYLSLRGFRDTSRTETLLEVVFQPKNSTGLLLYAGLSFDRRGDFICVALVKGKIVVSLDLGKGPASIASTESITINTWHSLRLKRIGRGFSVVLGGESISRDREILTPGNFVQLTIADNLYVGGHPNPDHISALLSLGEGIVSYKEVKGFTGCVQSLLVNGERMDLVKDALESINVVNCDSHECAGRYSPCGFHGQCIPDLNSWRCDCNAGYGGSQCQKEIESPLLSSMAFKESSYLSIEKPVLEQSKESSDFKIVANISKMTFGIQHEILFIQESKSHSRVEYTLIGLLTNNGTVNVDIWNLPIGWPPDRPISSSITNYQSAQRNTRLDFSNWQAITAERKGNELVLSVNNKKELIINVLDNGNQKNKGMTVYIGGAPQALMDKLDFLRQMHPRTGKFGKIRGFNGCIASIKLRDESIGLNNASKAHNIDYCQ